ncbi:MAG: hypothetical protein JXR68_08955 [Bacteroidales bacterium]|nr:hypothetical protein [Bacteroidales bacterium]
MKFKLFFSIIILCHFSSFSQRYLFALSTVDDFNQLSGLPLNAKYGQVSAVKIVYDLKFEELYFIGSDHYKYHHEFCRDVLNYRVDLAYYNEVNYSNTDKKRFLLANINFYESLDIYALELSPVDLMTDDEIEFLYKNVAERSFFVDSLYFLVNSTRLMKNKDELSEKIPLLFPDEIYKNLNYQGVANYENYGILKIVYDLDKELNSLTPKDIIIINHTPLYLPNVAGIIVSEFQTPLSHLTILGQNRKIPICAYKDVYSDEKILSLNNEKVKFTVMSDTFKLIKVDKLEQNTIKNKPIKLKYDLSVDSLVNISDLGKKSDIFCGNKASNFGILYQISQNADFKTPESAFVIPFYFYSEHVKNCGAQILIDNLLENKNNLSPDSVKFYLDKIQKKIKKANIDTNLISSITSKIQTLGNFTRLRFRSSTNAEDAKGFSGAGLYDSKTGILFSSEKSIDDAIKKVWASLWSYQAFMEREYYNIDQSDVYMGILVHRAFPSESVNGVAITKNPYRRRSYGFLVNAQIGNISVVSPDDGIVSDQFVCYPNTDSDFYENRQTVDIITISNLNNGELVMSEEEIQHLANQLAVIKKYFFNHGYTSKTYTDFGLDIEFKLDGPDRQLYIKQVRLYND